MPTDTPRIQTPAVRALIRADVNAAIRGLIAEIEKQLERSDRITDEPPAIEDTTHVLPIGETLGSVS